MSVRATVVVACTRGGRALSATLAALHAQTEPELDVVLVESAGQPERPPHVTAALRAFWPVRLVAARLEPRAAAWNAALEGARGRYAMCLEEGDRPAAAAIAAACDALDGDARLTLAAVWTRATFTARLEAPPACTLTTALAGPDAIPPVSVFRRQAWAAAGKFDETLPTLEDWDLWLRLLRDGAGVVVDAAIVETSGARQAVDAARRAAAVRTVLSRHESAVRAQALDVLWEQECRFIATLVRHKHLVQRRNAAVAGLEAADREIGGLEATIRNAGREATDWGELRRTNPISRDWGFDRGAPVDRWYIERFVARHADDVAGVVLEVKEGDLTARVGGGAVDRCDVVDIDPDNPKATIFADLRAAPGIADATYDCIILTQTLHLIDDMPAALRECARLLKPGGVLLATLPCLSRVSVEYGADGDFWRVTPASARKLFGEMFPPDAVDVRGRGNVLAGVAFSYGLAAHELTDEELAADDPSFPLLVTVRAVKTSGPERLPRRPARAHADGAAAVLLYHRVAEVATDPHGLCVPVDTFRAHMEHLAAEYRVLPLEMLADGLAEGRVPPRAVALTFDDGYLDNVTTASPILVELGLPATFFLTSAGLDGQTEFWWDALERIFLAGHPTPPTLSLTLDSRAVTLPTRMATERRAAHDAVYPTLLGAEPETRDELLANLFAWCGAPAALPSARRPMNAAEARRLIARAGHAVGAHGVNHLALPRLTPEARRRELVECRTRLEALFSRRVTSLAYPFGDVSDAAVADARACGFDVAVTCEATSVRAGVEALRIPRLNVATTDSNAFARFLRDHLQRP